MFRFSSENLPFSAHHGSGQEPIFAAMMAIWFIRLNQRPCRDCQNAASGNGFESGGIGAEWCRKKLERAREM
jgi:hypothetical protein